MRSSSGSASSGGGGTGEAEPLGAPAAEVPELLLLLGGLDALGGGRQAEGLGDAAGGPATARLAATLGPIACAPLHRAGRGR